MLKQKIKAIMMVSLFTLGLFASANAAEVAAPQTAKFAIEKVEVKDTKNVLVTFNKNLYTDVSLFELTLETKEAKQPVNVNKMELAKPNQLQLVLASELNMSTEYNLVVIFATDVDGNVIEKWVDGMSSFIPNNVLAPEVTSDVTATGTTAEDTMSLTAANETAAQPTVVADAGTWSLNGTGTAVEAVTTEALPQTWPKEVVFVVLAMLLSLALVVRRKNA